MSILTVAGIPAPQLPDAACADIADPDMFFAVNLGGRPPNDETRIAAPARAICGSCSARIPCLEYALENGEMFGIWGGLTPQQRWALRRAKKAEHPGTAAGSAAHTQTMKANPYARTA